MTLEPIYCDPELWGKHLWYTMEAIACTLNDENRSLIHSFFESLQGVIPCPTCKEHYCEYYQSYPIYPYLRNSLSLIEWLYQLKCIIKKRQNRIPPPFSSYFTHIVDYYDVPELYELVEQKMNLNS